MELYDNRGSAGKILIDGEHLTPDSFDFGREPYNDQTPDSDYRTKEFSLDQDVSEIELYVWDITQSSEVFIDDLVVSSR